MQSIDTYLNDSYKPVKIKQNRGYKPVLQQG